MQPDTFAIVTAYNEADLIGATLAGLAASLPAATIYLADDGSKDATAEIARAAGARVISSERVIGKGAAATLAAEAALADWRARGEQESGRAPVFLLCDGDLGDSAAVLAALVRAVADGEADLAVASFARRVGGGLGLARGFARWAIRACCGVETIAPISGQRALNAGALQDALPFAHGFGMEMGMTIDAVRAGHRLVELELELTHRAGGRTVAGFAHRGAQLLDFVRVYLSRGRRARR